MNETKHTAEPSARRVPEKIINKIASMYTYDLQTAYEKGLKDE